MLKSLIFTVSCMKKSAFLRITFPLPLHPYYCFAIFHIVYVSIMPKICKYISLYNIYIYIYICVYS